MSNDFDKAVDFLQGALNAAAQEVSEPKAVPEAEQPAAEELQPAVPVAPASANAEAQPAVEEAETAEPTKLDCPCAAAPEEPPATVGLGKLAASILVAVCTGIAIVATHKLISPRIVEKEVVREAEPDGLPLALLPETADASLWDTVAGMSGTIDGVPLQFRRGIAEANGKTYKVCLDFCRSKGTIYVRVAGNGKWWVAQVAADGKIVKAYPARANAKPLKDVFGK